MGGTTVDDATEQLGSHHVQADPDSEEPLSTVVVEALAAATGEDPTSIDFHLYDAVDFEALDALYRHAQESGGTWQMEFTVEGFDVVAHSDGRVSVQ